MGKEDKKKVVVKSIFKSKNLQKGSMKTSKGSFFSENLKYFTKDRKEPSEHSKVILEYITKKKHLTYQAKSDKAKASDIGDDYDEGDFDFDLDEEDDANKKMEDNENLERDWKSEMTYKRKR